MITRQIIRNFFWKRKKIDLGKYKIVEPGNVSPMQMVPNHISKPSWYQTGEPTEHIDTIDIKSAPQIDKLKTSCKLAANILKTVGDNLKIGQTTDEIDRQVHELTIAHGAYPSPLNYKHFPKSVCTSINNVACHGIPDDRPLHDGDIINIDITVYLNGYHGDCSRTFLVGNVDEKGRQLVVATETCLMESIELCKPGARFNKIGAFIEYRAKEMGFGIVPAFVGHGIGSYFHGPPDIYHIRNDYPGTMKPGMSFTIEPVLTHGGPEIIILEDNWTAVTLDFARTAQFEHTILVNENGAEILTLPD